MIRSALALLVGLGFVTATPIVEGSAWAQSDYPTTAGLKASRHSGGKGTHGYFDVGPGQTQPIVNVKEPEVYRVCIQGEKATVVADGNAVQLDHGDCYDVEAKDIKIEKKGGQDETEGTFHRRGRRGGPPDQRY